MGNRIGTFGLLVASLTVLAPVSANAQTTLTPQQLEALGGLSPDAARALLGNGNLPTPEPTSRDARSRTPQVPTAPERPPDVARIAGGDTIVVTGARRAELRPEDLKRFNADPNRVRLVGSQPFILNPQGVLALPGIADIPLAGLSAAEAEVRLEAEALLAPLDLSVKLLPVLRTGAAALKPFGYALFQAGTENFSSEPGGPAAVTGDYQLGPGDSLRVQFFGGENYQMELVISAEGTVTLPKIGPEMLSGLSFAAARQRLESRISERLIGTRGSVSMGRLKTIRVFVVGDVKKPGAFDVSGAARITNVLFASGGITEVGSLRRVQLKRGGELVHTLDLYSLLLYGNTGNDVQLQNGDVVLVPPAGSMVTVDGEVKRPAIYELGGDRTLAGVLRLAGGLQPTADRERVQVERIGTGGIRSLETINLAATGKKAPQVADGDVVRVPVVLDAVKGAVLVEGHVSRPGAYEHVPGMRVSALLPTAESLKPRADLNYVLVRRETGADRRTRVLSVDLQAVQAAPGSAADLMLEAGDRLTVFELGVARSAAVDAILRELETQATREQPFQAVRINGNVRAPGTYPLEDGMTVHGLIRAGGGLTSSAHGSAAELARYPVNAAGERTTELLTIDLAAAARSDAAADVPLQPYDVLTVQEIPAWEDSVDVEIAGEVRFPGRYPVRRGETLASVMARAGGLTELAFPDGSVFTRKLLIERETRQLELMQKRVETDLAALAVQRANQADAKVEEAWGVGQSLLDQLRSTTPTGRLVIDLSAVMANPGDLDKDIELRDGDRLLIPPRSQEVTVVGEVQYPTSHRHDREIDRNHYIDLSGGFGPRADERRTYVVRANGAVLAGRRGGTGIEPGDTIVVPLATDRLPALAKWSSVTQIIYNLAIAVAAVNSF